MKARAEHNRIGVADEMAETLFPVLAGGDALAVDGDREMAEEEEAGSTS